MMIVHLDSEWFAPKAQCGDKDDKNHESCFVRFGKISGGFYMAIRIVAWGGPSMFRISMLKFLSLTRRKSKNFFRDPANSRNPQIELAGRV